MGGDKGFDDQPLSRRDFLKLKWAFLFGAGLVGTGIMAYLQYEADQGSENEVLIDEKEISEGSKTIYSFSLKNGSKGEFFERLQRIKEATGLESFTIEVDHEKDEYFNKLIDQILTDEIKQKFSNLDRPKSLALVTKRILEVMNANEVSYFDWAKSDENLEEYFTYPSEIGTRIGNNIYTCFEGAVFTREVFKKLGLDIPIAFVGIHANLEYKGPEGDFAIEPLFGKVFSEK